MLFDLSWIALFGSLGRACTPFNTLSDICQYSPSKSVAAYVRGVLVTHVPLTFNSWLSSTNNVQLAVCLARILKLHFSSVQFSSVQSSVQFSTGIVFFEESAAARLRVVH